MALLPFAYYISEKAYVRKYLGDIVQYMIDKNCMDPAYMNMPVEQVVYEKLMPSLLTILLRYAKDNIEVYAFFYKVLFLQINIQVKDLRKNLLSLGKPLVESSGAQDWNEAPPEGEQEQAEAPDEY
jgi:hypothetical protein